MWFKNIRLYRLLSPFSRSSEEPHKRLLAFAFQPCGLLGPARTGWATDAIRAHVEAGKLVVTLSLSWAERLSCLLGEYLTPRRLRFSHPLQERARRGLEAEDPVVRMDTNFSLMTLELSRFIPRLLEALGGEDRDAYAPAGQAA